MNNQESEIRDVLLKAQVVLNNMVGNSINVLEIYPPDSLEYAKLLATVVSKLSPLIGNMIEHSIVTLLNENSFTPYEGFWSRQDPGFPDTIFNWAKEIKPGIEVKTWFPLATEITARFKDSVLHFDNNQTDVAVVAWLPEYLIFGKPKIIDVFIVSAKSLAIARDRHYHNPPDYLVFEPEDTKDRTINLQQTNTNGYKFQGTQNQLLLATEEVSKWGTGGKNYSPLPDYQKKLKSLLGRYNYRLDTNYAKIDRIEHPGLEQFKTKVLATKFLEHPISYWSKKDILDDGDLPTLLKKLKIEV